MPLAPRPHHRFKVLISRHRDGEINALAAERFGIGTVRGLGDHGGSFHRKGGGPRSSRGMLRHLQDGGSMGALTADVPGRGPCRGSRNYYACA